MPASLRAAIQKFTLASKNLTHLHRVSFVKAEIERTGADVAVDYAEGRSRDGQVWRGEESRFDPHVSSDCHRPRRRVACERTSTNSKVIPSVRCADFEPPTTITLNN